MFEQFTSLNEVHNEVNTVGLLKYVVHSYDERVVDLEQNQLFNCQTLYWLMLDNDVFTNTFHRVQSFLLSLPYKVNFAESTVTNDAQQLKIVESSIDKSIAAPDLARCSLVMLTR